MFTTMLCANPPVKVICKLKPSVVKDLKLMISLEKKLNDNNKETDDESVNAEEIVRMKSSGYRRNSPNTKSSPINTTAKEDKITEESVYNEEEYNFND